MKKTIIAIAAALAMAGCGNSNTAEEPIDSTPVETLVGIESCWSIDEAMGISTEAGETAPFICFEGDSSINGNASVNTFNGSYAMEDESLTFSNIAMTKMMGASMEVEDAITKAMNEVAAIKIDGDHAVIMNAANDTVMKLTRKAE